MKLSIVCAVLNSHEVVRRQILHYQYLGFPREDAEVIFMDDGSDPPLYHAAEWYATRDDQCPVSIVPTHDTREWTWAVARNSGAKIARGEYLLMTDIDYIIPKQALDAALAFTGDKMRFRREFGVLDEKGQFTQDHAVLQQYGLSAERLKDRGTRLPPHPNNFVMRKELFLDLGGYLEDRVGQPYPQREDGEFKRRWMAYVAAGKAQDSDYRPTIYMFPNGQYCAGGDVDSDPMNLFHKLTRKTPHNPWHTNPRYA